jgi:hypothetical protein
MIVAPEDVVTEGEGAGAGEVAVGRERAAFQRGERDGGLEGGARRVEPGDSAVLQRVHGIRHPAFPGVGGDALVEELGVEGGVVGHGEDFAGERIEHHGDAGLGSQALQREILQAGIEGQSEGLAAGAGVAGDFAHDFAMDIGFGLHEAGGAAQGLVLAGLGADAADAHAGQGEHGVRFGLALVGAADIADGMGEFRAERVDTAGADFHDDAGEVGGVDLDGGHVGPFEIVLQQDGDVLRVGGDVGIDAGAFVGRERNQLAEIVEDGFRIRALRLHEQSAPVLLVAGQDGAEAISDDAALGRDQAFADAVGLGEGGIFAVLLDLQVIELGGDGAEQGELAGADQEGAAREGGAGFGVTFHRAASGKFGGGGAAMGADEEGGQRRVGAGAGEDLHAERDGGEQAEGEEALHRPEQRGEQSREADEGQPVEEKADRQEAAARRQRAALQQQ